MKSSKILYTSADVRKTIIDMFENAMGRRVAITAFVGSGSQAFLRRPEGIELVCWPQAGGTNPDAIRELVRRGVKVSFAKSLHMKVYWTEDQGAVITSANLSKNALGAGNLKEFGIFVPSEQIDIDRLLRQINAKEDIKGDLLRLDKAHRKYHIANRVRAERTALSTYPDWYADPYHKEWKVGLFGFYEKFSQNAKDLARIEYGVTQPHDFISTPDGIYSKHEWLLTFTIKNDKPVDISWLHVDEIVATDKKDKVYDKNNPCQAIQMLTKDFYPPAPFKIDQRFRSALTKSVKEYQGDDFPVKPTKRFLNLLYQNYNKTN